MENELNEVEIRLKDMFFYTLRRWRTILLFALILALLMAGIQLATALPGAGASSAEATEQEELENDNAAKERYEKTIQLNQDRLQALDEYCKNSILMNLDSYHVYRVTCRYFVETGDGMTATETDFRDYNLRTALLRAYDHLVQDSSSYTALADKYGCDPQYIRELVTFSIESENIFKISVIQSEQELAGELMDHIVSQIEQAYQSVSESICAHTVHYISKSGEYLMDETLTKTQSQVLSRSEAYTKEIDTATEALSALSASSASPSSSATVKALKKCVKSGIIGFILGACVSFVVYCAAFLMSDKLYSAAALNGHCKKAALLSIPKQKSSLGWLDRLILKLEERATIEDDGTALLVSTVKSHCAGQGKVLVTGDFDPTLERYSAAVQDALSEDLLLCKGSLLRDAAVMDALSGCDSVLLIESCGKSLYRNISAEIALTQTAGKHFIGCIVVD